MINSIVIAVYVGVAVICGGIFAVYGYKKGWKGGLSLFCVSAVSALLSFFLSPVIAGVIGDMPFITALTDNAYSGAENIGLGKEQLSVVVEKSIDKVLEIPAAIILFILFFIILAIVAFIVRKIMKCSKEQGDLKSKLIGLSLASVSIPLVLLFTVLVGKINIFDETKRADTVIELVSKPEDQLIEEILHNNKTCTDIYFDTKIIEADDSTRLSLINSAINGAIGKIDDNILKEVYSFKGYTSEAELSTDLSTVDSLYTVAKDNKLFEEGELLKKIFDIEDKKSAVDKIYSLNFRDTILRYVLTSAIRSFSSDDSYVYPADIDFTDTEDDMVMLIETVQKVDNGEISKVEAAKTLLTSPLVPRDVVSDVIENNISNVVGEDIADKVTEYIEENKILDKIADNDIPLEEVTEFIDKLQSGELEEEIRIEEIEDFIKDNEIIDKIEQGDLGIDVDDELIDDIKNGNFSDISLDDIMNGLGITQ
ncbi:MAG: hypothetical protein E7490_03490 [Ruminococcaceae bacterium]|nr:hypothetical protein [Oscillospiraceae bacterium]